MAELEKWSVQHNWTARVQQYDTAQSNVAIARPAKSFEQDPVDALMGLVTKTLARAAAANTAVTRPNEIKSLIDAATNALKLVAQMKAEQQTVTTAEDIGRETERVLLLVEQRQRRDALELAIDICKAKGVNCAEPEAELKAL
jgi:hypothetical protein